jgi:hypothetical protein
MQTTAFKDFSELVKCIKDAPSPLKSYTEWAESLTNKEIIEHHLHGTNMLAIECKATDNHFTFERDILYKISEDVSVLTGTCIQALFKAARIYGTARALKISACGLSHGVDDDDKSFLKKTVVEYSKAYARWCEMEEPYDVEFPEDLRDIMDLERLWVDMAKKSKIEDLEQVWEKWRTEEPVPFIDTQMQTEEIMQKKVCMHTEKEAYIRAFNEEMDKLFDSHIKEIWVKDVQPAADAVRDATVIQNELGFGEQWGICFEGERGEMEKKLVMATFARDVKFKNEEEEEGKKKRKRGGTD